MSDLETHLIISSLEKAAATYEEALACADLTRSPIKVLANVIEYFCRANGVQGDDGTIHNIRFNTYLIGHYSHLFDAKWAMTGPTGLVGDGKIKSLREGGAWVVTARTFSLNYRTSFEEIGDRMETEGTKVSKFPDYVYHDVSKEYAGKVKHIQSKGYIVCPYIPLIMIRAVDSTNFQPHLCFKTRFGLLKREGDQLVEPGYSVSDEELVG